MPRTGRPTKLTPEVQNAIVDAIRRGNYIETAATIAGISKDTLYKWLKRGNSCKKGVFRDFSDAIKKAIAESEDHDITVINSAASMYWQAAAWRLERKFPDKWGRKDRVNADTSLFEDAVETPVAIIERLEKHADTLLINSSTKTKSAGGHI